MSKNSITVSLVDEERLFLNPNCLPAKTDIAYALAKNFQNEIRHHATEGWFYWTGTQWRNEDPGLKRLRSSIRQCLMIMRDAAFAQDAPNRIVKFINDLLDGVSALIKIMEASPPLSIDGDCFDQNPYLLNCLNGSIDLRTRTIQPHTPDNLLSKMTPFNYIPDAPCVQFQDFLDVVFDFNSELIRYVQKTLGYATTADAGKHLFWLWYGPTGRNGKSVLANIVRGVLGTDYSSDLDPNSLDRRDKNRIPTDIMRLKGVRFLSCREPDVNQQLNASLLKTLIGGDTVVARNLYRHEQEFNPHFKLNILTNHLPNISSPDEAFWQRVRVIPFNVHVPSVMTVVENLADKLVAEEGPGILAWLVRGAQSYYDEGIDEPPEVLAATEVYRIVQTPEGQQQLDPSAGKDFIDRWLVAEKDETISKEKAYKAYQEHIQYFEGLTPVSQKAFGQTMASRGFERLDVRNFRINEDGRKVRAWYGVRLKDGEEYINQIGEFRQQEDEEAYGKKADVLAQRTGMRRNQACWIIKIEQDALQASRSLVRLFVDNYRTRLENEMHNLPPDERQDSIQEKLEERRSEIAPRARAYHKLIDMAQNLQKPGGNIEDADYRKMLDEFIYFSKSIC